MVLNISRPQPVRYVAVTLLVGALYDEFVNMDGPWGLNDYAIVFVGGYAANALSKEVM